MLGLLPHRPGRQGQHLPRFRLRQAGIEPQQHARAPPGGQPGNGCQQSLLPGHAPVPGRGGACSGTGRRCPPTADRRASLGDDRAPQVAGGRLLATERPAGAEYPRECLLNGLLGQADVAGHAEREPDQFLAIPVIEHGDAFVPPAAAARIRAHNGQDYQPRPGAARPDQPVRRPRAQRHRSGRCRRDVPPGHPLGSRGLAVRDGPDARGMRTRV